MPKFLKIFLSELFLDIKGAIVIFFVFSLLLIPITKIPSIVAGSIILIYFVIRFYLKKSKSR
ncbi:hypothetical protein AHYW_002632 [Providencia manganoxydans]